jgi:hypothetical protein
MNLFYIISLLCILRANMLYIIPYLKIINKHPIENYINDYEKRNFIIDSDKHFVYINKMCDNDVNYECAEDDIEKIDIYSNIEYFY